MLRSLLLLLAIAAATPARGATAAVSLPVEHRASPGGGWAPLGTLTGALDAVALAAVPRAKSPSLTLTRSDQSAPSGLADAARVRGGGYSVRVLLPDGPPLVATAPAACAAAAGGILALKLDGTAAGPTAPGNAGVGGLDVTGVSFDFYSTPCRDGDAPLAASSPLPQWSPPATSIVPLWLPASAPPLWPAPPDPSRRVPAPPPPKKEGAAGSEDAPPVEDTRTWLQKNWMMVLPAALLISNLVGTLAAPPPPPAGRGASTARGGGPPVGAGGR